MNLTLKGGARSVTKCEADEAFGVVKILRGWGLD